MLRPILCILAGCLLMSGCTTAPQDEIVTLPAISNSPSEVRNPGQVIWHDLATGDLEESKIFYGELLGWTFEQLNDKGRRYTAVYNGGERIAGMFEFTSKDKKDPTGEWLVNLSTDNVADAAAAYAAAGGVILEPAREVPNRGTAAFVRDPQQAVMVLTRSSSGDPVEGEVPVGGWLWNELWTHDGPAAMAFYKSVFGYDVEEMEGLGGRAYYLLKKNDTPVGGMLEIRNKDIRPHWVPFIRVADLQVSLLQAMELGANILIEPTKEIRDGKVALLQTPSGEPIVLQEYSFESN